MSSIWHAQERDVAIQDEHWCWAMTHRLLSHTPEDPAFQTRLPVAAHHDQINLFQASGRDNLWCSRAGNDICFRCYTRQNISMRDGNVEQVALSFGQAAFKGTWLQINQMLLLYRICSELDGRKYDTYEYNGPGTGACDARSHRKSPLGQL